MRRSFVTRPPTRGWRRGGRRSRIPDILLAIGILGLVAVVTGRLERVGTINPIGVARVSDGDSLELAGQRIRLRGIDAPELDQICRQNGADYRCGHAARDALRELIGDRDVACTGWERDRYKRLLAICVAGTTELNRELVASGWAVAYGSYAAEEAQARGDRRGLWGGEFDQPQEWRVSHGDLAESPHDFFGAWRNWLRQLFAG